MDSSSNAAQGLGIIQGCWHLPCPANKTQISHWFGLSFMNNAGLSTVVPSKPQPPEILSITAGPRLKFKETFPPLILFAESLSQLMSPCS